MPKVFKLKKASKVQSQQRAGLLMQNKIELQCRKDGVLLQFSDARTNIIKVQGRKDGSVSANQLL
jgi:hypothetical protein